MQKNSVTTTDAFSNAPAPFHVPFSNNVSVGSLLLAFGAVTGNLEIGNVTDSLGNTYTPLFAFGGGGLAKLWYTVSLASGPCTMTYDLGAFAVTTSSTAGVVMEYSGTSTGGVLDGSSANQDLLAVSPMTTGNVTALGTKELLLGVFVSFYDPLPWGDFTPGVDQNPGNHNPFTLRAEVKVQDPFFANEYWAIRVIDFIGAGINPSGSQEITATGSDPSGGDSYGAVGASFVPA